MNEPTEPATPELGASPADDGIHYLRDRAEACEQLARYLYWIGDVSGALKKMNSALMLHRRADNLERHHS